MENKRVLCLNSRKELSVSGVKEVVSFDENGAELLTEDGTLCIDGEGVRISNLDTSSGQVFLNGRIDAMTYVDDWSQRKKGLFGRVKK